MIHHELDDDPGALAVVLQADDAHYVAQVLHICERDKKLFHQES